MNYYLILALLLGELGKFMIPLNHYYNTLVEHQTAVWKVWLNLSFCLTVWSIRVLIIVLIKIDILDWWNANYNTLDCIGKHECFLITSKLVINCVICISTQHSFLIKTPCILLFENLNVKRSSPHNIYWNIILKGNEQMKWASCIVCGLWVTFNRPL